MPITARPPPESALRWRRMLAGEVGDQVTIQTKIVF
jgi:hypothetical protein